MKVAILHYHLNAGGVTRVIQAQVKGLLGQHGPLKLSVISGLAGQNIHEGIPVHTSDLLFYNENPVIAGEISQKVNLVMDFLKSVITDKTILHCHNGTLGKNPALTLAIYEMARQGYRVLNQVHDFPEDRPANLTRLQQYAEAYGGISSFEFMYPSFRNYHFAVLTTCDFNRISSQGIPSSRIHLLPNSIMPSGTGSEKPRKSGVRKNLGIDEGMTLCTYPVRAIARKNIGELILLATLFSETCRFAITLAPLNPSEIPLYYKWKELCKSHAIPVIFEAASLVNYEELTAVSDFCISTSTREGFGMTFLEPWQAGVPVIGRELPCIINDLTAKGLVFPRLYSSIVVHQDGSPVDFALLSPGHQEAVITEILTVKGLKQQIFMDNPFLHHLFDPVLRDIIENNRMIIQQHFSTEQYGRELFEIYQQIPG